MKEDVDVKALLIDDNRVLFVLEREKSITKPNGETFLKPSKWGMPGGRSESIDGDEIAVVTREVEHEIGILPDIDERMRVERKEEDHLKVVFLGYPMSWAITMDPKEILDARWFPRRVIYDSNFNMYSVQRGMAQELLEKLRRR